MNSPKIAKFVLWCLCASLALSGCAEMGELQKPLASPYYGALSPAPGGEFRWANGELPKTFDPALAQSPSEMQAVRAAFDGLTDWDPQTLQAVPALAARWEPSEDFRTWTFNLRPAAWSNGKRITAADFVRSWRRLKELGANSPHQQLISNIIGARQKNADSEFQISDSADVSRQSDNLPIKSYSINGNLIQNPKSKIQNPSVWFGVEAVDGETLRVYLRESDKDFPKLAAHSALRPVAGDGEEFKKPETADKIVSSGAFRFVSYDKSGVVLERSKNFWNAAGVKLERVRFVPTTNAESALAAYRAGEVDAVTNAHIEPLALKLLASYRDFERTAFNAVTFYEFNRMRQPFGDRRVRDAMAMALDRERLANDEFDGATFPAKNFLPHSPNSFFKFDVKQAQTLMTEAGFAGGKNFPKIRLLINRNDAQRRLAKAVAAQWQKNLGVETEIVVSSLDDLENSEATKGFDLVRRVVVLPTTDETISLQAMFAAPESLAAETVFIARPEVEQTSLPNVAPAVPQGFPIPLPSVQPIEDAPQIGKPVTETGEKLADQWDTTGATSHSENQPKTQVENQSPNLNGLSGRNQTLTPILSEAQAFDEIPAIPLYFPSSYALVKPYVKGFEPNLLDAPSLKNVEIQIDWQPPTNQSY